MFILIKHAGRSITMVQHPTMRECAEAEAIVQIDGARVTIRKNRGKDRVPVQICGHPLTSIVSSDGRTHYCHECVEEGKIARCVRDALDYLLVVQEASLRKPFLVDKELSRIIEYTDKAVARLLVARAEEIGKEQDIGAEAGAELRATRDLARRLAIALAAEVAFHGDGNSAETSLSVLSDAREQLDLADEFDAIDSLRRRG